MTASGLPVITAPSTATVALNQVTKITGVSLSESGSTSDETLHGDAERRPRQAVGDHVG